MERELAIWLRERGALSAKRTEQYCGNNGDSDVTAEVELPSFHIESKATKEAFLTRGKIKDWVAQIKNDCPPDKHGIIFWKPNGKELLTIFVQGILTKLKVSDTLILTYLVELEESFHPHELIRKAEQHDRIHCRIEKNPIVIPYVCAVYELEDTLVIGVKAEWFLGQMLFFDSANKFKIVPSECNVS